MVWSRRRFLAVLALAPLSGCGRRAEDEPLWLGHLAPLSGAGRRAGEHARQGIGLAVEAVNKDGRRKVAVAHADTRGQPERARDEAVRLLAVNRVAALLADGDVACARPVAEAAHRYTTPVLTAAPLTGPAEGAFSLDVDPAARGVALARYAAEELKKTRAVVLADEDRPAGAAVAAAFVRHWRGDRKRSAWSWALEKGEADRLAGRLEETKPEVVVVAADAATFLKLRRPAGAGRTWLFAGEAAEWARLGDEPGGAEDVLAASVYPPAAGGHAEAGAQFLAAYRERYKAAPDFHALAGHEMVLVAAAALRATQGVAGAKLREELGKKDATWPGLTGELSFRDGHARRSVFVVRGAGGSVLKEYRPDSK